MTTPSTTRSRTCSRSQRVEALREGRGREEHAVRARGAARRRHAPSGAPRSHDEFAAGDGRHVVVDLVKLDNPIRPEGEPGSVAVDGEPAGKKMGRVVAGRGHMVLLPANAAYRFTSERPGVILLQTILGRLTPLNGGPRSACPSHQSSRNGRARNDDDRQELVRGWCRERSGLREFTHRRIHLLP